jgi:hypothetical protein
MAKIHGVVSGLMAGDIPEQPKRKKVKKELLSPTHCEACGGRLSDRERKSTRFTEEFEGTCTFCVSFFGMGPHGRGCCDMNAEEVKDRFEKLREQKWAMVLKAGSYGTHSGLTVEVEPGDIFQLARVGLDNPGEEEWCSRERTMQSFTITINIGTIPLVLFPHEVSAISFITIMQLKQAGELEESFVSSNDPAGHFRPNQELREQIYATFGSLVNAPKL